MFGRWASIQNQMDVVFFFFLVQCCRFSLFSTFWDAEINGTFTIRMHFHAVYQTHAERNI